MRQSQIVQGGSDNIFGRNIVVGSGTINVSETQLAKIPDEYAKNLSFPRLLISN